MVQQGISNKDVDVHEVSCIVPPKWKKMCDSQNFIKFPRNCYPQTGRAEKSKLHICFLVQLYPFNITFTPPLPPSIPPHPAATKTTEILFVTSQS